MTNEEAWNTPHSDGYVPPTGPSTKKGIKGTWVRRTLPHIGKQYLWIIPSEHWFGCVATNIDGHPCGKTAKWLVLDDSLPLTGKTSTWAYCGCKIHPCH